MAQSSTNVDHLSGMQLDYGMYQIACKATNQSASKEHFEKSYAQGQFHFSSDREILSDLIVEYSINIQLLAGEWLASNTLSSVYGSTPTEAACRLVLKLKFGDR